MQGRNKAAAGERFRGVLMKRADAPQGLLETPLPASGPGFSPTTIGGGPEEFVVVSDAQWTPVQIGTSLHPEHGSAVWIHGQRGTVIEASPAVNVVRYDSGADVPLYEVTGTAIEIEAR